MAAQTQEVTSMMPDASPDTLGVRIATTLAQSEIADPREIADLIRPGLTPSEMEDLVMRALVERIRTQIGLARHGHAKPKPDTALPRGRSGQILWPSIETLAAELEGDSSFKDAAERFGVSKEALKKHCNSHGITDCYGRISERYEEKLSRQLTEITREFADEMRAEGIAIGLEQANTERVCVAGEWKFLGDCTPRDLRVLADEYRTRAGDNIKRGAYYLAIAEQVEASGQPNVRAMCERERLAA